MLKKFLISPGPTSVPEKIKIEITKANYHHHSPQFKKLLKNTIYLLKKFYQTINDVFILTSSGSGAMEAAITNTLSYKDQVIIIRGGKFGERWGKICESYGINTIYIDLEWGKTISKNKIIQLLKKFPNTKAVFSQYCESSTGTYYDIQEISKIVKKTNALMIVDAISGLGVYPCLTDEWKLDVVICGSQKSLMLPPGISFISFSNDAWKFYEKSNLPKFYFDLKKEKNALLQNHTAYTPAINLIAGLYKSLTIIINEGLNNRFKHHKIIANAVRSAVKALGLELFSESPCNSLTAIKVPKNIDGEMIPKLMRDKYGVVISGGQNKSKGKIFRIGHLGYIDKSDLVIAFQALEFTLRDLKYNFEWGSSLRIIQKYLYSAYYST